MCALAQGADGTARELEKLINKTKASSKLQHGYEELCEMKGETEVLLSKAGPVQEGAWSLQGGPGSMGTSGGREGSCASHLHPGQAELGANPRMLSLGTAPAQQQGAPSLHRQPLRTETTRS